MHTPDQQGSSRNQEGSKGAAKYVRGKGAARMSLCANMVAGQYPIPVLVLALAALGLNPDPGLHSLGLVLGRAHLLDGAVHVSRQAAIADRPIGRTGFAVPDVLPQIAMKMVIGWTRSFLWQ